MSFRQNHESGNRAVALLATCLVVVGGAATCVMVVVASDPEHPRSTLTTIGAVVAGAVVLLWLLRDKPPENRARSIWGWLGRRRRRKVAYRVRAKLPPNQRSSTPPAPPTAESIRAVTGGTSTWVPAAGTQHRPPSGDDPQSPPAAKK